MLMLKPAPRMSSARHAPMAAESDVGSRRRSLITSPAMATVASAAAHKSKTPVSRVKKRIQIHSAPRDPRPAAAMPKSAARWISPRANAPAAQTNARRAMKPGTKMKMRPRWGPKPWPITRRYKPAAAAIRVAIVPGTEMFRRRPYGNAAMPRFQPTAPPACAAAGVHPRLYDARSLPKFRKAPVAPSGLYK